MKKTSPPPGRLFAAQSLFFLGGVLAWLAASSAQGQTYALGTTALLVGPSAGSNSVVLAVTPQTAPWTATANAPWLHLTAANQSGTGSANVVFSFDPNASGTRSNTLTIAGQTLTVTQAGSHYVPAQLLINLGSAALNEPYGVAVDVSGNVYIADTFNNAIKKWSVAGNTIATLVSSNLNRPTGVAVDLAGNVYIADTDNDAIKKWSVGQNSLTTLVSNLNYPYGVAVDAASNVYVADTYNNAIKMWPAANGKVTTLVSNGLNQPWGVAVDLSRNVYIADTFNNAIKKWSPASSNVTTLVPSGLSNPSGVAVDGAGNVYIADNTYVGSINVWSASQTNMTALVSSGLFYPSGVAVDGAGNVYVADTLDNAIKERPYAFVDPTVRFETNAGGNDTLPVVLPPTANLLAPFAPTSDTNWLAISLPVTNGAVSFSFMNNASGAARTGHITLLGQSIAVTQSAQGPSATTLPATAVTSSNATLNAWVNAEGAATAVYFVYGATTNYGGSTLLTNIPGGNNLVSVGIVVTGLLPAGAYHFQAIASNSVGAVTGLDSTFTTLAAAPQAITQAATAIAYGSATLNALVNPEGAATTVCFVYGANTNYGHTNVVGIIGAGTGALPMSGIVTGLLPAANYHFQVIASNNMGAASGGDLTFTNSSAAIYTLATTSLVVGPAAGAGSVVLSVTSQTGGWTNTETANWLHLSPASQSGAGSANVVFSFDPNTNGTRSDTLAIAGQTLTVTQAGASYVAVGLVTNLANSGLADPLGVAVDLAGNVYIADAGNNAVKLWTATNNTLSTLVSNGLNQPWGVAVDGAGNVYIADSGNNAIKLWTAGETTPAILVSNLNNPRAVAVDAAGNVYIADSGNNAIKLWTAASSNPAALVSSLNNPRGVAVDAAGNVYIADSGNNAIKLWMPASSNTTTLVSSNLNNPTGLAVDTSGNLYFADTFNNLIKKWSAASSNLSTLVSFGLADPIGVAVDGSGDVYIANTGSNVIQELPYAFVDTTAKFETNAAVMDALPVVLPPTANLLAPFTPASDASWLAISLPVTNGVVGFSLAVNSGLIRAAHINLLGQTISITQGGSTYSLGTTNLLEGPAAGTDSVVLAVNPNFGAWTASNNAPWLHLSLANQSGAGSMNVVFSFDANPGATRSTTLALANQSLTVTQAGSTYVAVQLPANLGATGLDNPYGVAVDASGNVYIADTGNSAIQKWTAANNSSTLVSSNLGAPRGVAVGANGNVYIADYASNAVYLWAAASTNLTALVSNGLNQPWGVAAHGAGDLYVADYGDFAIKKWTAASSNLTTLVSSALFYPSGTAVDAAGNVYIADTGNNAIKEWTAANSNLITLVSGLAGPAGVAVDGSGNVYFADSGNNEIDMWKAATGNVATLVSSNLNHPTGVAVDGSANLYFANTGSNAIQELPCAFVDTAAKFEPNASSNDTLVVLPATASLLAPFAPASSDTTWLNITGAANGVVSFSFSANTSAANRSAQISVLGQSISITQGTNAMPLALAGVKLLGNGVLGFSFTNNPLASFSVLSTTNLSFPLNIWTLVGTATNTGSGLFQFTSPPTTNDTQRFYLIRSP